MRPSGCEQQRGFGVRSTTHDRRSTATLQRFTATTPSGVHAILIWGGAGYHTSPKVVPANISLIQLIPYSPELNPVENLWHFFRIHYWSPRVDANYEALEEAAITAWQKVCLVPESIRSICAAPYVNDKI